MALVTLGCSKNTVDSEIMLGSLHARGFRSVPRAEDADLIVVNTCAFLTSAVEEGIDTILEMSNLKSSGRCRKLVVAGCMVERYRKELEISLPEVDQFVSTDELLDVGKTTSTTEACFDEARRPYFLYDESMPRLRSTADHTCYLKIAEGCDRPCSFCIIPKIRGRFRSRKPESILAEAQSLLRAGVKELNLVAQDLTAYGSDFNGRSASSESLLHLLEQLDSLSEEDYWLRLFYAYPVGVTESLVRRIKDSKNICNYLDLPLQHISKNVLKLMRRPLGEKGTRSLIEKLSKIAPEVALRTTFIVGFPGETEEDILALEEFVSSGFFTHIGVFTYSQEQEAVSFDFPEQVDPELAEERRARIMEAQQQVVRRRLENFVGRRMPVLVDGAHSDTDLLLSARTNWQGPEDDGEVIINDVSESLRCDDGSFDAAQLVGNFGLAEITEVAGYDLVGKLI
ncbi:ribosomal protein S12 methylthiotransferase RimO [bacterium J17]|nr:ribosomal protein S12 methylthiotransferase RimO [bacterium J17]